MHRTVQIKINAGESESNFKTWTSGLAVDLLKSFVIYREQDVFHSVYEFSADLLELFFCDFGVHKPSTVRQSAHNYTAKHVNMLELPMISIYALRCFQLP